ncbi:MAG: DUF503 domain-containing protein [Proteobacteria bacterium]|nr:DUF503 domain-containing protein [Pseudomonadota bacterium]
MYVCACHLDLLLLDKPDSLKGKRHVVKSLKERLRSRFGISVAEVGSQDLLHRSEIGIAFVGERRDVLESVLDQILHQIECQGSVEIMASTIDFQQY